MTDSTLNVLGIAGSLRKASFSAALLTGIAALADDTMRVTTYPLHDIPLYNQDLEPVHGEGPAPVLAFRKAIHAADGLIVVAPEYNYGMSGVLKNALDWASRPAYKSVLAEKPVLIISQSPGISGGVRAHAQLRQTFFGILARVVPTPELTVHQIANKLSDGRVTDEQTRNFLKGGLSALAAEILRSGGDSVPGRDASIN